MDPVSAFGLVSGAFQVGQVITETLAGLASLRGKYQHADLTINTLEQQLTTIRAAITQLENWSRASLRESPAEYNRSLDVALDGCRTVMEVLWDEIRELTQGTSPSEAGIGFRTRMRVVWREDVMRGHQERLQSQVIALHLLVNACQCESSAKQVELLRKAENRHIIWKVADDAATLRSSARTRNSGSRADTASSLSRRVESTTGDTVFDFDRTLADSLPYQRIPRRSYSRPQTWSRRSNDNQSQTTDEGYASGLATTATVSPTGSLVLPGHPSGMISPTFGHNNSEALSPTSRTQTSNLARRSKSDSTHAHQLNRSSDPRGGRFQSVIRRFSLASMRSGPSSQVPTQGSPDLRRTRRRPYEKDVNTSIDLTSPEGASAPLLVKTAQAGSRSDVEKLLERGCDLEEKHPQSRRTALLVAAHCGNERVVELLIRMNARLDAFDISGSTALHLAASRGHCGVLELLAAENPDFEARDSKGRTALWVAAERGELEATQLLLLFKAQVNARADAYKTPLHVAAKQGDEAIVKLLVKGGADLETKDGAMMTALHYACEKGHVGVMEILLDNKIDIDVAGPDKRTPLICAAAVGGIQATQLLLKKKASSQCADDAGMTAMHWAAYNGHVEIVEILSKRKSSLTKTSVLGRTALHLAAMNSQFAVVEFLLRKGIPVEMRCQSGLTALHYACLANNIEISKLLLMSGADIEAQIDGELQRRPVHIAAVQGSMGLLNLLCDKGASLEARDTFGYRALGAASRAGHAAAVQNLLDRGSPVHLPSDTWAREDSPLCLAAAGGHIPVVALLLERGASPLKQDEHDWWPYQYAAYHGHPGVLEILLSRTLAGLNSGGLSPRLQLDGIGFALAADISEERKQAVLGLLYRAKHQPESLIQRTALPNATSSTMGARQRSQSPGTPTPGHIPNHFVSPLATAPEMTTRAGAQELPGTLEQGLPESRSQTPEQMHRPPDSEAQSLSRPIMEPSHERNPVLESRFRAQAYPPWDPSEAPTPPRPPLSHPTPIREPGAFLLGDAGLFGGRFDGTPVSIIEAQPPSRTEGETWSGNLNPNSRLTSAVDSDSESTASYSTASEGIAVQDSHRDIAELPA